MKKTTKDIAVSNGVRTFNIKMSSVETPVLDITRIHRQSLNTVPWGDRKNSFTKYLSNLTQRSLEHQLLIDTKGKQIYSKGLAVTGGNAEAVELFLSTITSRKKDANQLLRGFSRNYPKFEIAYFEVIYGKGMKQIVNINPLDTVRVLPNKGTDKYGEVVDYTFCANFDNLSAEREIIPRFDVSNPAPKQIMAIYIKGDYQPYFPDLSYGASLNYVELSFSISKYLLSYSDNSMTASGILNINAEGMSDEDFADVESQMQTAFSGAENAGRIFVFGNPAKESVSFQPLSNPDNTQWITALNDIVISKICSIHKANPMIAGISGTGNSFSSNADEANEAFRNFYLDQIQPAQELFLDFLEEVLDFNGYKDYDLSIVTPAKLKPVIPDFVLEALTQKKWAELYDLDEADFEGYVAPAEDQNQQLM